MRNNAKMSPDEWTQLIINVSKLISNRTNKEDAHSFVEEAYKEFVKNYPNLFKYREQLLEFLCKDYLSGGNLTKAHKIMDRIVCVSMAEISFSSKLHNMSYYSFRPFSDYSLKDIKNETISLAHPRDFNDPLDTVMLYWLNHKIDHQSNINDIDFKYSLLLKKVSEHIKLRCFIGSVFKDKGTTHIRKVEDLSFLMWSHYAKSHTGFCVEYEFSREMFDIDNTETKILLIEPVSYPKTITIGDTLSFKNYLFEKSNFWEYEHEVRLALFDSTNPDPEDKLDYPTVSCKNMIKAVYLGVKCSDMDRLRMIKAIGDKDIPLYQMEIDDKNITRLCKIQIG